MLTNQLPCKMHKLGLLHHPQSGVLGTGSSGRPDIDFTTLWNPIQFSQYAHLYPGWRPSRIISKHIKTYKKNNSTSICDSKLWGTDDQLPRLLAESDFVVVAVPLLPATRNMIGVKAVVTARGGWCDISRSYPGWFVMTVMNYGWCGI